MLKAGLKQRGSRAAVLDETLMSPDSRPNYSLPSSLLAGSRPERLNQLFAYLPLLCKYFGFFWPCLQSNFHLFFFFLISLYWKSVWKASKLIKGGSDIIHVDVLAVTLIWKPQLQWTHLSCKKVVLEMAMVEQNQKSRNEDLEPTTE